MAEIKFYQDAAKTIQVYPEINPDGTYPGVTVGLADNLASTDGIVDSDTWQYRSSGGELDISDGYADLRKLVGTTESSTIEESLVYNLRTTGVTAITLTASTFKSRISASGTYNFIYTPLISYSSTLVNYFNRSAFATYVSMATGTYTFTFNPEIARQDTSSLISSFNASTFASKVNETPNTYVFTYDGSSWKLDGNSVTLSQYGITTKGTEVSGSTFTIYYTANSWFYNNNAVSMSNYGITTTGAEHIGDTITINYTGNEWQLNGSGVTLSYYGITITAGTAAIDDNIQVVYTAEEVGVIVTSNPTALFSIGMNQFDKNGTFILTGYTIGSNGAISASSGSYVIYFKCLGDEVYTIYDDNANSIVRVGYSASAPTTSSTVTVLNTVSSSEWADVLVNDTKKKHYKSAADGFMCVATTDIEDLCCHLTWEGVYEEVYESYFDSTLTIPYVDENGTTIRTYGLVNLDDGEEYYDEIDFAELKWYKRTDRIAYSATNLANVQAMGVPYLYDANWIYYGIDEVVYNLADISSAYKISNYGTEEFIGSSADLTADIFYQDNLKDKLRFSCEVIDNKVDSVSSSSTTDQYPSAKCVYDLDMALRHILGLDVDTFSTTSTYAVGDYVVYKLKLWKCTTAVSSAGAWTGDTVITKTSDSNGVVTSFDHEEFETWLKTVGICAAPELYAENDGSYTIHLTYASTSSDAEFADASELLSETGITVDPTKRGTVVFSVGAGNWTESYLFKA